MRQYNIYAYQPIPGQASAPELQITIDRPMPDLDDLHRQARLMDEESATLADVLIHSLPSGVLHRLTGLLLIHSAGVMCRRDEDIGKGGV